jgi:hypothetical protein
MAIRLTSFPKDHGLDLSGIQISDDGAIVTFVRGSPPNQEGAGWRMETFLKQFLGHARAKVSTNAAAQRR